MVRDARPEDAEAVARVHAAAWRAAYTGLIPQPVIDEVTDPVLGPERFRRGLADPQPGRAALVWDEPGHGVTAIASFGPARAGPSEYPGEVYVLYVQPELQRGGRGRALLAEAARRLDSPFLVWVLRDNAPARAFYERLGGSLLPGERTEERFGGVVEVAYGWTSPLR